jgi:hypothetical protein
MERERKGRKYFCLMFPFVMLSVVSCFSKIMNIRSYCRESDIRLEKMSEMIERFKLKDFKYAKDILYQNHDLVIDFNKDDNKAKEELNIVESCLIVIFSQALILRKAHDTEEALLFEDFACRLIARYQETQDPRLWLQNSLRRLPQVVERHRQRLQKLGGAAPAPKISHESTVRRTAE